MFTLLPTLSWSSWCCRYGWCSIRKRNCSLLHNVTSEKKNNVSAQCLFLNFKGGSYEAYVCPLNCRLTHQPLWRFEVNIKKMQNVSCLLCILLGGWNRRSQNVVMVNQNTCKYIITAFYSCGFTKRTLIVLYEIFIYRIYTVLYFTNI